MACSATRRKYKQMRKENEYLNTLVSNLRKTNGGLLIETRKLRQEVNNLKTYLVISENRTWVDGHQAWVKWEESTKIWMHHENGQPIKPPGPVIKLQRLVWRLQKRLYGTPKEYRGKKYNEDLLVSSYGRVISA